MSVNLLDTANWLPLDGLAPGFDANKAPHSPDLAGRTITLNASNGSVITHTFTEDRVIWGYDAADGDPHGDERGDDSYEAFLVDEDLYFVQFHTQVRPLDAVSLVLDLKSGRSLTVVTVIDDEDSQGTRVKQLFDAGTIVEVPTSGTAPAPSRGLIGRRVMWVYSPEHAYEHIYLSPEWYTWQCLAGPEKGLADTDENTVYEIRPGIFVFAWREKVIPCASVTIADHRNVRSIRSHGALFGLDESGEVPTHFTFGAFGRLISTTVHPKEFDPAG
ncbi:molybdenum cofactor biosynthesis F family protein [Arthrobacter sp. MMS24-S77]